MKKKEMVHQDISNRFKEKTNEEIATNSVMDFYTLAISETMEDVYSEIESNKNPYLYSGLRGKSLDDLGFFLSIPRLPSESDEQYLFRLMNWKKAAESANETAINTALLSVKNASYATYIPLSNGSGTATVYIIPLDYSKETKERAIKEAMEIASKVISPSTYVEYVMPAEKEVIINAIIRSSEGDLEDLKRQIKEEIKLYVNDIAPNGYLQIGFLNRIGVSKNLIDYFNVINLFIDGTEEKDVTILQKMSDKFLLKEVIFTEE